jgi:predicted metal-binding protein
MSHDITNAEDYREYQKTVEANTKGLHAFSTGACPGCDECGLADIEDMDDPEYDMASEPHFSWSACDICNGRLGGDRYPAHFLDSENEIVHVSVCSDCYYYTEYGRLDDMKMMDLGID